jgi:phosphoribosyl 1,2-cyclic phosphodiesterase
VDLTFWGVRGAIPAPGPETNRYGGNTPCVTITSQSGAMVIIDAGTGIVQLGRRLMRSKEWLGKSHASLLLSHTHWDHIQGFPFFGPVYIPGNSFDIYGPKLLSGRLESLIEGQMNPNFSPLQSLKNLGATFNFHEVGQGETINLDGIEVRTAALPHGHTVSLAFRLTEQGRSLVYASDVGYPTRGVPEELVEFYRGADVLVHDSTYTPEEQAERRWRGYSSVDDAAMAAAVSGVKRLALFHYDQDYNDEQVDALAARARHTVAERGHPEIEVIAAAEGLTLSI